MSLFLSHRGKSAEIISLIAKSTSFAETFNPNLPNAFAKFSQRLAFRRSLAPSLSKSRVSHKSKVTALIEFAFQVNINTLALS
jgi:hypothetical protein